MGELSPWHLLILAAVFIVLFGSRKLPDAARSLGRSMRIFKAETQSLRGDHGEDDAHTVTAAQQAPAVTPQPLRPPADDGTTVNGVPISEVQQSKQPS
jgi:sec-independent protein translocase protein TatA